MDPMAQQGCSLEDGEILERFEAWRDVSSRAISREVQTDRITSIYPSETEVVTRLKDLIAAEAVCCSFLEFTLQEEAQQTTVVMSFPPKARQLVEGVISAPGP